MPQSVRQFATLFYASLVFGLIAIAYLMPTIMQRAGLPFRGLADIATIAPTLFFSFAIPALLVWLAASRRKNWARIALAVFYVLGLGLSLADTAAFQLGGAPLIAIFALQTLLQAGALLLVFSTSARPWFAQAEPPDDAGY